MNDEECYSNDDYKRTWMRETPSTILDSRNCKASMDCAVLASSPRFFKSKRTRCAFLEASRSLPGNAEADGDGGDVTDGSFTRCRHGIDDTPVQPFQFGQKGMGDDLSEKELDFMLGLGPPNDFDLDVSRDLISADISISSSRNCNNTNHHQTLTSELGGSYQYGGGRVRHEHAPKNRSMMRQRCRREMRLPTFASPVLSSPTGTPEDVKDGSTSQRLSSPMKAAAVKVTATTTTTATTDTCTSTTTSTCTTATKKAARKSSAKTLPITELREMDVLFGRGSRSNRHCGNRMLLRLARQRAAEHRRCGQTEAKHQVCFDIMQIVSRAGGRFIAYDDRTKVWYEAPTERVRGKITQAIRTARRNN